jgi:site-specific DNA recombinase
MTSNGGRGKVSAGQTAGVPVFDSYARLSWNPSTRELEKIETQHGDNEATIARHGGTVGRYLDDGLWAWKAGVRRKDFETLLERAQAGLTQGIAVWHVDRLFRQPRDLERLIDLADHGFRVISSHGSRDLSDPDDRYILRIEVAHAARSSDDTSRRIKRRHQRYREEGRPVGGPPGFGFERRDRSRQAADARPPAGAAQPDRESERPIVPAEQVAAERHALRDAVADLLAGLSNQSEIARRWNTAGLLTATGQQWEANSVRDTLVRPALAGRIEFEGELISRMPGESIIVERDWLRLRAMIESRRRGRPPAQQYLGSGVIRCGACGKKLGGQIVRPRRGGIRWRYSCNGQRGGCGISIDMPGTDGELRSLTIARLSDSRYAAAIATARAQVSDRLATLTAEIDQIERLAAALSEKVGRREMTLADFDKSYSFLRADLEPLLAEREQLSGGAIGGPTEALSSVDVARHWDDAETVAEQRAMLVDAIGADHVRVLPAIPGTRKHVFNPDRIVLVPAAAPFAPAHHGVTTPGPIDRPRGRPRTSGAPVRR